MTMGIGLRPSREPGVVLITDSFEWHLGTDNRWSFSLGTGKLNWLVGTETAVIISGEGNDDLWRSRGIEPDYRPLLPGYPQEADPRSRVRRTFFAIQEIDARLKTQGPQPGLDGLPLEDPGPHALFAIAAPSLLAKFTTKTETWAEPGDVFAIGGWLIGMPSDIALEMQLPAPETLEECKSVATEWVCRYIDKMWGCRDPFQTMRETDIAPGIGGPLQVLTLTPDQRIREEIPIIGRSVRP
jgi:hypothetical protein